MTAIDWREIHARLEKAKLALQQAGAPGPEETERILSSRARALAQEGTRAHAPQDVLEIVAFTVAGENYGVESAYVREVYALKALTRLPGTPPFVLGIVNLRGRILSVVDIKKFFDLPDKGLSDLNKLVILGNDAMTFGVLADAIEGIRQISLSELQPSLPAPAGVRGDYVRGVSGERLVVLAAERLLSDPKLLVQQKAEV